MALSSAERQAKYREQKRKDSSKRLDVLVSSDTRFYIEHLCERYSVTQKALIEKLVLDASIRSGIAFRNEHIFLESYTVTKGE